MLKKIIFASVASFALLSYAQAAPTDEANAHFNAIASGDVATVMQQYAAQPMLELVGGPLNGTYVGADKVHEVWAKFAKANSGLKVKVDNVAESTNQLGATVTANVVFQGQNTIKVRYVLTFRDGKISTEIWQIDPKLVTAAY